MGKQDRHPPKKDLIARAAKGLQRAIRRGAGFRRLLVETLEDRSLLSATGLNLLPSGTLLLDTRALSTDILSGLDTGTIIGPWRQGSVVQSLVPDQYGRIIVGQGNVSDTLSIVHALNLASADTTNTDQLWSGGGLGLDLTGAGYLVGVWDGGYARLTHQELAGRVSVKDTTSTVGDHATHVTGTIAAAGIDADAHGMATAVGIWAYDWNNDIAELGWAGNSIVASNHSYSFVRGWAYEYVSAADAPPVSEGGGEGLYAVWLGDRNAGTEDANFGKYDETAQALDATLYANPNLLSVWAAGNDRGDSNASGNANYYLTFFVDNPATGDGTWRFVRRNDPEYPAPFEDGYSANSAWEGYDTLPQAQTAKNNLVVGAIQEIRVDPYTGAAVVMTSFSGWGPTDDGRIKPDVVADGNNVYSTASGGDTAYEYMSGTSMAAPNVTGTVALLVEHFHNTFGYLPLSSTTKAVILHTAFDAGNVGPDYAYGWGVLDAAKAADLITRAATQRQSDLVLENTYRDSTEYTLALHSSGGEALRATLAWIDPAASVLPGNGIDNRSPVLVNDLDLWISDDVTGEIYRPWTLDPANPNQAATRDQANTVDNVEQVVIDAPTTHGYTLHVRGHGGAAFTQRYSLVVSGAIASDGPVGVLQSPTPNTTTNQAGYVDVMWLVAEGRQVNGATIGVDDIAVAGVSVASVEKRSGNTWRYYFNQNPAAGIVTVQFVAGQVLDDQGTANVAHQSSFTFDLSGPLVVSHTPANGAMTPFNSVTLRFNEAIDTTSFNLVDDIASFTGPSGNDLKPSIVGGSWSEGDTVLTVRFSGQTANGRYSLTLGPQINDRAGNAMNQNGSGANGEAGDAYSATFYTLSSVASVGFEAADNMTAGFLGTQGNWNSLVYRNGTWQSLTGQTQPSVSVAMPNAGTQHLRLGYDAIVAADGSELVAAFSPWYGSVGSPQASGRYALSIDIAVASLHNGYYDVIVQSLKEQLLTAYIRFAGNGSIYIANDGGGTLYNTGATWQSGQYRKLEVQLDAAANQIDYYYGGELIWSTSVWGGSGIDRLVLLGDNRDSTGTLDVDDLQIASLPNLQPDRAGAWWDDRLVVATLSNSTRDDDYLYATDDLYATFSVRNTGGVSAAVANVKLYLDGADITPASGIQTTVLGADNTFTYSSLLGKLAVGAHTLRIVIDPGNSVDEGFETDNEYVKTIVVSALGSVSGVEWNDVDFDGVRDSGEETLAGWKVYVDANHSGAWDADEPFAITGADGTYTISGLKAGHYTVAHVSQAGWATSPITSSGGSSLPLAVTPPNTAAPAAFDLRAAGLVTPVRDRQQSPTDWIFAAYASLESSLLRQGAGAVDLSENHLKNYHRFDLWPGQASYYSDFYNYVKTIAEAYLSRGDGPVAELADPYQPGDNVPSSSGAAPVYHLRDALEFNTTSDIKAALRTYGVLATNLYWDDLAYRASDATYYYQGTAAYPNYSVAIVGWDDAKVTAAGTPGAWLVKDSRGTSFGESGYFWISYSDTAACKSAVSYATVAQADAFRHVYQYDDYGAVGWDSIPIALNVFTAQQYEQVAAVQFYTSTSNVGYDVRILDTSMNILAQATGSLANAGLHTVDLPSPAVLAAGQTFYVYLEFTTSGALMAYDYRAAGFNSASQAGFGESYYSFDGEYWSDAGWSSANFCIKALTIEPSLAGTHTITLSGGQNLTSVAFGDSLGPASLSIATVPFAENVTIGTVVGTLAATAGGADTTFTFSLASDGSHPDNAAFAIDAAGHVTTAIRFNAGLKSTYTILAQVTDSTGRTLTREFTLSVTNVAPRLDGAFVRGSQWQASFLAAMAAGGAGDATWGIRLVDGANQLANSSSVAWGGVDRLTLHFNEAVNVTANSLILYDSQNHVIGSTGFAIVDAYTAEWSFATLTANRYWFQVVASQTTDLGGLALDGEWTTGATTYAASGNGQAGGDLNFRFNVLAGDANGDGATNVSDVIYLRSRLGRPLDETSWRYDLNASGGINVSDVLSLRSWLGISLGNFVEPSLPTNASEMGGVASSDAIELGTTTQAAVLAANPAVSVIPTTSILAGPAPAEQGVAAIGIRGASAAPTVVSAGAETATNTGSVPAETPMPMSDQATNAVDLRSVATNAPDEHDSLTAPAATEQEAVEKAIPVVERPGEAVRETVQHGAAAGASVLTVAPPLRVLDRFYAELPAYWFAEATARNAAATGLWPTWDGVDANVDGSRTRKPRWHGSKG